MEQNQLKKTDVVQTGKAKIIEVVFTEFIKGFGSEDDPIRPVQQYWTRDGELLFEKDPLQNLRKDDEYEDEDEDQT